MVSSSSSRGGGLRALESNVSSLVSVEQRGSALQMEMLEHENRADGILNGLVISLGFLLLYTVGGLILQVSNKIECWSAGIITVVVTITSGCGMTVVINMARERLRRMDGSIRDLNERRELLMIEVVEIGLSENERIETAGRDIGQEENAPLSIVRAVSVAVRSSGDMSSFATFNRRMIWYILASTILYLIIDGIFFIFNNYGIVFFCKLMKDCPR